MPGIMNGIAFELMECFSGFWSRRLHEGEDTAPWIFGGVEETPITQKNFKTSPYQFHSDLNYLQDILLESRMMASKAECEDLRDIIRKKAEKHRRYYECLADSDNTEHEASASAHEMARELLHGAEIGDENKHDFSPTTTKDKANTGSEGSLAAERQRRQGVYELSRVSEDDSTIFKSVKQLRENYLAMLEKTSKNLSSLTDKKPNLVEKEKSELLLPPPSGYCSSSASGGSDDERDKNWCQLNVVRRSGSSDSAVHSDEDVVPLSSNWGEKREDYRSNEGSRTIKSPYSPRGSIDHSSVPSRTIIEAQCVPLPIDRKFSVDCVSDLDAEGNISDSRRQSCFSEGDEQPRYRYWRTPSVVVSDYSDDVMGLSLEDIEYIRNRKENSSSPDSSLHSSCSNLNYCGSSISALEGEYVLSKPYRKSSNCSTCSTLSDEEGETSTEPTLQPQKNKEKSTGGKPRGKYLGKYHVCGYGKREEYKGGLKEFSWRTIGENQRNLKKSLEVPSPFQRNLAYKI